ncbi:MAG TPA: XrtA/PEP-CTERM system exopolysaccharide export protein [Gammaproteobacteria bacterium]|jgi:polysaccharide export outer membrane protein|nr:XrtA/PEP-CTERM system exopolysaccharide export protein [Gammaproteobacteria bacterium]
MNRATILRYFSWLTLLASTVLLGACASGPPPEAAASALGPPPPYVIGPGDTLEIYVRDNPDLTVTVPVRPDGRISIPLVQEMTAAGKTPQELGDDLEHSLSKYIRTPIVTVIVTKFVGSFSEQVRVVGQATRPQALPYRRGMTLLDVLIEVGGLTKFADGNDAKVIREVNGRKVTFSVHLQDLLDGNTADNIEMRPGDILIIPQSAF